MNSVVEVHSEDFYATVQPGVTRNALNGYIRDTGLFFPIGTVEPLLKDTSLIRTVSEVPIVYRSTSEIRAPLHIFLGPVVSTIERLHYLYVMHNMEWAVDL